jgi:hypothetical protein
MNLDDRLRASNDLDQRLRAAGDALREGSATQIDAASSLREIRHAGPVPEEPGGQPTASPAPLAGRLFSRPQRRLALAANLLLVLALGVVIGIGVQRSQDSGPLTPVPTARATATNTAAPPSTTIVIQARTSVPDACIETAELADEVISRLNRNVRDERLFLALRDYTIASQKCRREATP